MTAAPGSCVPGGRVAGARFAAAVVVGVAAGIIGGTLLDRAGAAVIGWFAAAVFIAARSSSA